MVYFKVLLEQLSKLKSSPPEALDLKEIKMTYFPWFKIKVENDFFFFPEEGEVAVAK